MAQKNIKPLLSRGDTIGLITPAGFISEEKLNKTIENFRNLGLNVFYTKSVLEKKGYLAGDDKSRINELHSMYKNEDIRAIACVRGGYGTTRLLDKIDYDLIKQNPKPLIGYSDITALINAIYKKTGIPGFHGIVGSGDFPDYTVAGFKNMFFSSSEELKVELFEGHKAGTYLITRGNMSGELAGGNLAMLASMTGTPFELSWDNKIVFLEDIGEAPYRIDRMLTQLISGDKFKNVKGIILGRFAECESEEKDKLNSFTLKEVLSDRIKPLKIPAVYGFSFGHIRNQSIFPTGVHANFDADTFTISIKRKDINKFFN